MYAQINDMPLNLEPYKDMDEEELDKLIDELDKKIIDEKQKSSCLTNKDVQVMIS